ncbi:large ribosomal subunit protein bL27m-like [Tubulanus polymorphus]|uniref:large ribosomal subunit protein bL27m-like n=1 Tax=Tubulanus polymorphus TaxID=672921 RepID=UPI003DA3155B
MSFQLLSRLVLSNTLNLDSMFGNQFVRYASKKSGGSSRNKKHTSRGKNRGIRVKEGQLVHKGQLLVKQLGMKYWPGENVFCDPRYCGLSATVDGRVLISEETLSPFPDSPLYRPVNEQGVVIKKHFVHVLEHPSTKVGRFKLVSLES